MSQAHSVAAVATLRGLVEAGGGNLIGLAGGAGPFSIGVRNPPVDTLLEQILAVAGDQVYERILCCTEGDDPSLPRNWCIGEVEISHESAVWWYRGQNQQVATSDRAATSNLAMNEISSTLHAIGSASRHERYELQVVTHGQSNEHNYWYKKVHEFLDIWKALSIDSRCLIVVDEHWLRPPVEQDRLRSRYGAKTGQSLQDFFDSIPRTKSDVVVFSPSQSYLGALKSGTYDEAIDKNSTQDMAVFAEFKCQNLKISSSLSLKKRALFGPMLLTSDRTLNLYDALRKVVPTKFRTTPSRPENPSLIMLDFWAHLDLDNVENALRQTVLFQDRVIELVVRELRNFCRKCKNAIAKGKSNPRADTVKFQLPAFLLRGASGMGKTLLVETLADAIFGDEDFCKLHECENRHFDKDVTGIEEQYQGGQREQPFTQFANKSGGLGAFIWDELDKSKIPYSKTLSESMSTLHQILPKRHIAPENPNNANFEGQCWFSNMLLFFTGNFVDGPTGASNVYKSIEDLAPSIRQRLTVVDFQPLSKSDIYEAVRLFLPIYLGEQCENMIDADSCIVAVDEVIQKLADDFEMETSERADERSFRDVKERFIARRLPFDILERLVLGADEYPAELTIGYLQP